MKKDDRPKTVLEAILKWSAGRPAWQRDALRRIVSAGTPSPDDVGELVALCRKGQGDTTVTAKAIFLDASHLPVDPEAGESVALVSISDVQGVNQLTSGSTVKFKPAGLNIVYGQNGTGKSGYARILKRACRARHAGEIMPNAFDLAASGKATAKITISTAKDGEVPVPWENEDQPHPVLSAITVFDRECGAVHLKQKNEVWFRPFGLDIPDDLAAVCQQVKDKLAAEKSLLEQARDPLFGNPIWSPESRIGKFLNKLTADSDPAALDGEQPLDEKDEARLVQLQRDLSLDPQKVAAEQRQRAAKIGQLLASLRTSESRYGDTAIQALVGKHATAVSARGAANLAAHKAFGSLELDGVGSTVWRELWDSARRYSEDLKSREQSFPPRDGESCVLCHQPVDAETSARMRGFEEFVQADTEARAKQAEQDHRSALESFAKAKLDIRLLAEARRIVREEDAAAAKAVLRFLASTRVRRWQLLRALQSGEQAELLSLAALPGPELEAISKAIQTYADELAGTVNPLRRQLLLDELANLKDRQQLDRLKKLAADEVTRLKGIRRMDSCIAETATTAVTKLGNDVADNFVTPRMRDKFAEEIGLLAAGRIRVEVVRSGGRFGSPQYEVRFFANAKAKVAMVLSEGEQTCVALASYLTELANASHKSALVFDDPVSSLDHRWRRKVAERLVAESGERQVVVFTHDLIFVNDLHEMAIKAGTMGALGSLSRSSDGAGVYSDGLPWRQAGVRDRVDKLEKAARDAKRLFESNEEEPYRQSVLRIYSELRAAWERGLEDTVFAGVLMRHRDYINTKNLKKVLVLEETDIEAFEAGFQKCCDFTEAHDASRARDEEVPAPDEMMADIQALARWERTLRGKQNAI